MQKGFLLIWILVGVLVIVAVAGGAYFLGRQTTPKPSPAPVSQNVQPTPTPDETANPDSIGANWKIYEDLELGFSLKYPFNPNFGATGYGHTKIINGVIIGPLQSEPDFYLEAYDNPKKLSPLGWVEAKNYRVGGLELEKGDSSGKLQPVLLTGSDIKITNREVGGQSAVEVTLSETSPKLKEYPHNPQVILFTSPDKKRIFMVEDATNEIIQTLKFLE